MDRFPACGSFKRRRPVVLVLSLVLCLVSQAARAEVQYIDSPVSMHMSFDKNSCVLGEPIVVTLIIKNTGEEPITDRWFGFNRDFDVYLEDKAGKPVAMSRIHATRAQVFTEWLAAIPPGGSVHSAFELTRSDIAERSPCFPTLARSLMPPEDRTANYVIEPGTYRLFASQSLEMSRASIKEPLRQLRASAEFTVVAPNAEEKEILSDFEAEPRFWGPDAEDSQLEALAAYKQVWTGWPRTRFAPFALYYAGRVHQKRGEWKDAIDNYSAVLKDYPRFPMTANVLYSLALAYESAGETAKARTCAVKLARRFPNHLVAPDVQRDFKGNPTQVLVDRLSVGGPAISSAEAVHRFHAFAKAVGWKLGDKNMTVTLGTREGEEGKWVLESKDFLARVDPLSGRVRWAYRRNALQGRTEDIVSITEPRANQWAWLYLQSAGAPLAELELESSRPVNRVYPPQGATTWNVAYRRMYMGFRFAGVGAHVILDPRDGSLISVVCGLSSPLPASTSTAVSRDQAVSNATAYMKQLGITLGRLVSQKTEIVRPDNYWTYKTREEYKRSGTSRLARVLEFDGPWESTIVWVDAENGQVLGGVKSLGTRPVQTPVVK